MNGIPIVDFGKCSISQENVENKDIEDAGRQICNAFEKIGFVYLVNTGINRSSVDDINRVTEEFFDLPSTEKEKFARSVYNFGYDCIAKERLGLDKCGDYKESFNMTGRAVVNSEVLWPDSLVPGFSTTAVGFMKQCKSLSLRILEALSSSLGLEGSKQLTRLHSSILEINNHSSLRCLRYPPVPDNLPEGQVRLLEHTDYGSLTLLFQDSVGGLQIKTCDGEYIEALPVEGAVLINVADILQYWTNGRLRSTPHRILVPSDPVQRSATRRSIAFFVHPSEDLPLAEQVVPSELADNDNVTLLGMSSDDLRDMTVGQYVQRIFHKTYS